MSRIIESYVNGTWKPEDQATERQPFPFEGTGLVHPSRPAEFHHGDDIDDYDYDDGEEAYCTTCDNSGYVNCYCGGDFCVCRWHGERPCRDCDRC